MLCLTPDDINITGGLTRSVTTSTSSDICTDVTYQLLLKYLEDDFICANTVDVKIVKSRKLIDFFDDFNQTFDYLTCTRSIIVKELFVLHQLSKSLDRFAEEKLNLSYQCYRTRVYYPNIMYLLIRLLPNARKFLQVSIRKTFQEFYTRSSGLINVHINSFFIDQDVIKSDVLYEFLGNGIKKFNPLEINAITSFYKNCFRSIFSYYFKRRRDLDNQDLVSLSYFDNDVRASSNSNRFAIYRDVLYSIQVKKTNKKTPILNQLSYNFQIFKNIIITNEFQNIYQNKKKRDQIPSNHEYKLIDFYDDDIFQKDPNLFEQLRQLPIIYKLLRCVHIMSQYTRPYNELMIKPDVVKQVITEELMYPFKNLFLDEYMVDVIKQVASNFVSNILTGEYINILTFTTVKINHISFLEQLRKFVRLCLK